MDKLKNLFSKHKDLIPYAVFGVLTTVVNIVVYWLFAHALGTPVMVATVMAWFVAVLFAYLTNRRWVFHSEALGLKEIAKEAASFFGCRMGTELIDIAAMYVLVDQMRMNDIVIKTVANIVVIVVNYVASKFVIFKHKAN